MAKGVFSQLMDLFDIPDGKPFSRMATQISSISGANAALGKLWSSAAVVAPSQDRRLRFRDYDSMESYSDIATALDIYAEEATQVSDDHDDRTFWVECKSKELKEVAEDLLLSLEIEKKKFGIARTVAKHGEYPCYLRTQGEKGSGVSGIEFLHPSRVERVLNSRTGAVVGYRCDAVEAGSDVASVSTSPLGSPYVVRGPSDSGGRPYFDPWEFVFFSIEGSDPHFLGGRSMLEPARRTWRELFLLETALAIYRIYRAGVRYVYYVDVGQAVGEEAREILELWKRNLKKDTFLRVKGEGEDSSLNELQERFDPMTLLEDIFWPISGAQSSSKVETLSSDANVKGIDDVDHFKSKLRVSLNIPKAFFDGDISGWNANRALAQQDVRFAKKTDRLQEAMAEGLLLIMIIHLLLRGHSVEEIDDSELKIGRAAISNLKELQDIEVQVQRWTQANAILSMSEKFGFDPKKWRDDVLRRVIKMSPSDIKKFATEMPVPGAPSTVPGQDAAAEGEFGPDAVKGDDDETKTAPGKNDVKGKKVKKTEGAVIRASHFPAVSSIEGRKRLYLAEKSMLDGVEGFEEVPEGFADILLEKAQKVFDALPETIADRAILQFHDAVSFTSKGGSNVSLDSDDPNVVRAVALIERMGGR